MAKADTTHSQNIELMTSLSALPDYHCRFENDPNDLINFVQYVNLLSSLKKKVISASSSSTTPTGSAPISVPASPSTSSRGIPVTPPPVAKQPSIQLPSNINQVFVYLDKLKKSPCLAGDLYEVHNIPSLPPAYTPIRSDHYPPVSTRIIQPPNPTSTPSSPALNKFNQGIYYNNSASESAPPPTASPSSLSGTKSPIINTSPQSEYQFSFSEDLDHSTSSSININNNNNSKNNNYSGRSSSIPIVTTTVVGNNVIEVNGANQLLGSSARISSFEPHNIHEASPISSPSPIFNYVVEQEQNELNQKQQKSPNLLSPPLSDVRRNPNTFSLTRSSEGITTELLSPLQNLSISTSLNPIIEEPKVRNWSIEFWQALQMEQNGSIDRLVRSEKIQKIAEEFVQVATKHGITIIKERSMLGKHSIPPLDVGGVAGGQKFLKDGIFFKFAFDVYGIYGGDAYAMKAAGHELKGLMGYFNCNIDGLYLPLMALIDYMGYRLIATSHLAIGPNTLVYGSNDQGENVHDDDPQMSARMKRAAEIMNLKGHYTGQGQNKKFLYGPCDIEGHITHDGHCVVIDTARIFPPEKPTPDRIGSHLYYLLRPELVRTNKTALSSDAFTKFGGQEKERNNEDVERAQKRLFCQIIPSFVLTTNQIIKKLKIDNIMEVARKVSLIDSMHREGINARYLARLKMTDVLGLDPRFTAIINTEIMARKIKNQLRELQRTTMAGTPDLGSIVKFFNKVFIVALLQAIDLDGFSLELLIHRLSQMTGIEFRTGLAERISERSELMQEDDIVRVQPKVKFLHMVPYQQGVSLFHQAMAIISIPHDKQQSDNNSQQIDNLLKQADEKFRQAIQSKPDDFEILTHWGMLLSLRGKTHLSNSTSANGRISSQAKREAYQLFEDAIVKFKQAIKIKRNYHYAHYQWAEVLRSQAAINPSKSRQLGSLANSKLRNAGVFDKKWFFGTLETNGAASLLSGKEAGSFIIRNSNSRPGSFVFSYLSDPSRKIMHSLIKSSTQGYHVENLPPRKKVVREEQDSSSDTDIRFNESLLSTSPQPNPPPGISGTPIKNHYRTLEEFVIDKIKQGYIPITQSID